MINLADFTGLVIGAALGLGFAGLQWYAQTRNEKRGLDRWLARLPGSMTRTALLLVGLAAVQILAPGVSLWYVTGGLILALAVPMALRLRRMAVAARH